MEHLDLSDIDPLKWSEVRRRADAVKSYIALRAPTAADRERFAIQLGLGAQQFSNLVKAWLAHQDASALSPGSGKQHRLSRSKSGGVDPLARTIAREVIKNLGAATPLAQLTRAIGELCVVNGVSPPSQSTVWLLVVEARTGATEVAQTPALLVATAFLKLPVDFGRTIAFPEALFAVQLPTGRIVKASLARGPSGPDIHDITSSIRADSEASTLPIDVKEEEHQNLCRSLPPGTQAEPLARTLAAKRLSAVLGNNIGRVGLGYRLPSIRPSTVMQSGRDRPLSVEDAELALRFACERHNAGLSIRAIAA